MKKWVIFVVFHKYIIDRCYLNDLTFDKEHFIFIKCNPKFPAEFNKNHGYQVIVEKDLPFYNPSLQSSDKPYMAVSAIYHVYKNELHKKYDYIGFMEYDLSLQPDKNSKAVSAIQDFSRFTEQIDVMIQKSDKLIVPLSIRHTFKSLFEQKNIVLNGKNAMSQIVNDYNQFKQTSYSLNNLIYQNPLVPTQQSFICDINTYNNLMKFIVYYIENKLAERPNSWKRPSTIMDRCIGVSLLLDLEQNVNFQCVPLLHLNRKEW